MNFKICLAIPILTVDLVENKKLISSALNTSPDLIELRFDYLKDINSLDENLLIGLFKLINTNIPIITTFRDYKEGGRTSVPEYKKAEIIHQLLNCQPDFLDVEMQSDHELLRKIINIAEQNETNLIFSYHNFTRTPHLEKILDKIQTFQKSYPTSKDSILKLIFKAQKFEDNFIPFELCKQLEKENIISFCMGEIGLLSRLFSVKFGSLWTYGSFAEKTAPGQIKIEKIRKIYKLFNSV
jgi:3-dehydroquinate dehydratase/shikimate dehydrogenase